MVQSLRQRYARHVHTCSRLLEDFKRKRLLHLKGNKENGGDAVAESIGLLSAEAVQEEIDAYVKKNKKLESLKKKIEAEREKVIIAHGKKEARLTENKKIRLKQVQEDIPKV